MRHQKGDKVIMIFNFVKKVEQPILKI